MATKYQIADAINGPFSEIFDCYQEAEKELRQCIREGAAANMEFDDEFGKFQSYEEAHAHASKFFQIVEVQA